MYIIDLEKSPISVLALWIGQHVSYKGVELIVGSERYTDSANNQLIYFTTVGSNPNVQAYARELTKYMNGTPGVNEPPRYSDYYRHLRLQTGEAIATRDRFLAGLENNRVVLD